MWDNDVRGRCRRIVSQPPGRFGKIMEVIVKVRTAFGLTVPEAKMQIMCLHGKDTPTNGGM